MEKLITIKPLDLTEVRVSTASPITNRRSKIKKDTLKKFMNFNTIKKGAISEQELLAIKKEIDINSLPEYEENLSLERLLAKLERVNTVLRKYGYVNLCISPENVKKLINEIPSVEAELSNNSINKDISFTDLDNISLPQQPEENSMITLEEPRINDEIELEEVPSFDSVADELEEIPRRIA